MFLSAFKTWKEFNFKTRCPLNLDKSTSPTEGLVAKLPLLLLLKLFISLSLEISNHHCHSKPHSRLVFYSRIYSIHHLREKDPQQKVKCCKFLHTVLSIWLIACWCCTPSATHSLLKTQLANYSLQQLVLMICKVNNMCQKMKKRGEKGETMNQSTPTL